VVVGAGQMEGRQPRVELASVYRQTVCS
jgi:hypothetical protein